MSILFLDFDGVLNRASTFVGKDTGDVLDKECCTNLQSILDAVPDLQIVISSSWRALHPLDWLKERLKKEGVDSSRVMGTTPVTFSYLQRGYEIQRWLDDNGKPKQFVILDDNDDMEHLRGHLVQTSMVGGLTKEKAEEVIRMLKYMSERQKHV